MDENRHEYESGIDPANNQPFLRAQVEITRLEVETNVGLGDFDCRCYASAGSLDQAIRSENANVKVACKFKLLILFSYRAMSISIGNL